MVVIAANPNQTIRPTAHHANEKGPTMTSETSQTANKPHEACIRVCLWCGDAVAKKNTFYNHREQPICWLCIAEATLNGQVTRARND